MIDPVDRAVRAIARRHWSAPGWLQPSVVHPVPREAGDRVLITEDTRRRLRTPGSELDERNAVELKGKQVHVQLWAPRAQPADASFRDRAGASVLD